MKDQHNHHIHGSWMISTVMTWGSAGLLFCCLRIVVLLFSHRPFCWCLVFIFISVWRLVCLDMFVVYLKVTFNFRQYSVCKCKTLIYTRKNMLNMNQKFVCFTNGSEIRRLACFGNGELLFVGVGARSGIVFGSFLIMLLLLSADVMWLLCAGICSRFLEVLGCAIFFIFLVFRLASWLSVGFGFCWLCAAVGFALFAFSACW